MSLLTEYVPRVTSLGRAFHLIRDSEMLSASPAAACGVARSDWTQDGRDLPICRTCAQHLEDRGVAASDLFGVCPNCDHGNTFHDRRGLCWKPLNMDGMCHCGGASA